MKANRAARAEEALPAASGPRARDTAMYGDVAGAETIGALILFAIFVATIAILNVSAVPNNGLAAEEEHYTSTLSALNGLQAEAESATADGATVARSIELAPARSVAQDFFSYFMASPARASGELVFEPDHGNLSVHHYRQGAPAALYDLGSATERLPVGRLTFDPHAIFRGEGLVQLENGGVVATSGAASHLRYEPPVSVTVAGDTTHVSILARVLNGTGSSVGGSAPVRIGLQTEASTLTSPASNNAMNATLRLETDQGPAWGEYLNRTSARAGLTAGTHYFVDVRTGTGGAPDVVAWTVNGTSTGNDVRLTTGISVFQLTLS